MDESLNFNQIYIELAQMMYAEGGDYTEAFCRLDEAKDSMDMIDSMTIYDMVRLSLLALYDEQGNPKPGVKKHFEQAKNELED